MPSRNLYGEVTARILAQLEAGTLPWSKPWKSIGRGNVPMNAVTRRPYSGVNVVMLWMTGYPVQKWLTFKQALEVGGNVRKGEKGTKVYFVSTFDKPSADDPAERDRIHFLKEYTAFNIDQCENLPARLTSGAAPVPLNTDERDADAQAFIASTGADFREGRGEAYYVPSLDYISMPAFESFRTADGFYATSFHELAHWTGAKPRLDRDMGQRFGSNAYAAEELVAELSAAFLCAEFGIDHAGRSASYIASWIKLLKADDRAFFTAASKAQKAADYLRDLALAEPLLQPAEAA